MKYLLDTNILIFLGTGNVGKIGRQALEIYKDANNEMYISQISYWEIAIKMNIGKLVIPIGLQNVMYQSKQAGIKMVPVDNSHIIHYQSLPVLAEHKDPFDRYIISVASAENLTILSSDKKFDLYTNITRIWE